MLDEEHRFAEGEPVYCEALSAARRLEALDPGAYLSRLAGACSGLGFSLRHAVRPTEAEELYREALSIWRALVDIDPELCAHRIAQTCSSLAGLFVETGRLIEAEPFMREELSIRRAAAARDSGFRSDLARCCDDLAWLLERLGRPAEAESLLREQADIAVAVLNEWPCGSNEIRLARARARLGGFSSCWAARPMPSLSCACRKDCIGRSRGLSASALFHGRPPSCSAWAV